MDTQSGERNKETPIDTDPSQPLDKKMNNNHHQDIVIIVEFKSQI